MRKNWSILSRHQSFTKKLTVKLDTTFFRKNWPNFEHDARFIFIHDLGRKLTTFCAFYIHHVFTEILLWSASAKRRRFFPLTFGLKVARYCPFEHMFFFLITDSEKQRNSNPLFSNSMPWAKCGLHVWFYGRDINQSSAKREFHDKNMFLTANRALLSKYESVKIYWFSVKFDWFK